MARASDQAAGLRRLLAVPACRVVTLLSAVEPDERDTLVINLAASLAHFGQSVVLMDGSNAQGRIAKRLGVRSQCTLMDVAADACTLASAIHSPMKGLGFIDMSRGQRIRGAEKRLEMAVEQLTSHCDVLLVTTELNAEHRLPIEALASGDLVVQVSRRRNAITSGYGAIKGLSRLTGRRSFGVLVTGTPENEARTLYANMAEVASRFLAISLDFVGSIPHDDFASRACELRRPVIEAFPLAEASTALRRIAEAIVQTVDRRVGDTQEGESTPVSRTKSENRTFHVHDHGQGR